MTDIVRNWRVELIRAYPNLFHPPAGHPESARGYPWCEEGWHDLLQRLCVRLEAALREGETIQILQIKEKFALLRVYWSGDVSPETAARLREAIALAEARSACTCERCGAEGRLYRDGGVYMTRCAEHAQGAPVPGEPGQENIPLIRLPASNGYRIGARRYDREADSFIDTPSSDAGSEET
ncbi:hypothetical protein [Bradyrhizobium sp. AS23.2]|uniref:hypothetical protein n=1 Tax=Bradyrhizobium sp. AS23.2 TaxID=1680155 RepID=UPI0009391B6B|nr:hypothetical protein [Bradyrhizobium sp. AS23.2]